MWARAIELMLGLWLVLTPFIFLGEPGGPDLAVPAFAAGALIWLFSTLSFWHPTRRAHLGNLAVSAFLVVYGYVKTGHPAVPHFQSLLIVGLLLVLFAIVPPQSSEPPLLWRKHYEKRAL